jgi:hypothetical protein
MYLALYIGKLFQTKRGQQNNLRLTYLIIEREKLLKYDWLMRRAFFLNSG